MHEMRLTRVASPFPRTRVSHAGCRVEVERSVEAPIDEVWSVLRDYEHARPRMLPEHFADYAVQDGEQGAGTVIAFVLRVGRRERSRGCGGVGGRPAKSAEECPNVQSYLDR